VCDGKSYLFYYGFYYIREGEEIRRAPITERGIRKKYREYSKLLYLDPNSPISKKRAKKKTQKLAKVVKK